jgi:hypothetical protein
MAVRDRAGEYVGTLEVVQDMEFAKKHFDLYGWISLMSQLIIINRALYVNK